MHLQYNVRDTLDLIILSMLYQIKRNSMNNDTDKKKLQNRNNILKG